jgi:hypothetical protein
MCQHPSYEFRLVRWTKGVGPKVLGFVFTGDIIILGSRFVAILAVKNLPPNFLSPFHGLNFTDSLPEGR